MFPRFYLSPCHGRAGRIADFDQQLSSVRHDRFGVRYLFFRFSPRFRVSIGNNFLLTSFHYDGFPAMSGFPDLSVSAAPDLPKVIFLPSHCENFITRQQAGTVSRAIRLTCEIMGFIAG